MLKYFSETKNRLFLIFIAWLSIFLVSYFYKETFLFLISQSSTSNQIANNGELSYFIFTNVTELFSVYFKLSTFASSQIFYLFAVYHSFIFTIPATFYKEYLKLRLSFLIFLTSWLFSAVFAHFFLIPFTWAFFLSFQNLMQTSSFKLYFEAKLDEFINFYISCFYLCEYYCQLFAAFLLILSFTKINRNTLKKFRKLHYYCLVFCSTLIAPPDVISQIIISLVSIFFYETLILFFLLKNKINKLTN